MKQRLFLHIGDCKTGSTGIQSMLAGGHCRPRGLRLFYPGSSAHGPLARSLGGRKDLYPARWQGIARRLAKADWDVAVLSSELFEFIQPHKVAQALRTHLPDLADTVTVVVYVRPHAARALSQFAENLKLGHDTGDMNEFLDRLLAAGRLRYCDRLAQWKAQFGVRLMVRAFHRDHLVAGDVRRDFLSLVLGGASYELRKGQDDNTSLTLPDLALMRLLQRRFGAAGDIATDNRVAFGKQFGKLLHARAAIPPGDRLRLPRAVYLRLRDDCAADAAGMDATWISAPCFTPALVGAESEVIDTAQSLEASDHHSPETLRQALVWADLIARQMSDAPVDFAQRLRPKGPPV